MEFNELILNKIDPILRRYNPQIVESFENYIKIKCNNLLLIIAHNPREKSNILWIARDNKSDQVEIDNEILSTFFHSDLKLSQVTTEIFASNLILFFENEAKSLLEGDLAKIIELESFDQQRSDQYTTALLNKQNLTAANKAWEENNYKEFIHYLDKTDMQKLPSSYRLKYRIAHQKLKSIG